MKRLLDNLAGRFDLDHRVRGVRIEELIHPYDIDLDQGPLQDFGTPGPADESATVSQGPVDLHYVPHLFPGMDDKLRLAHRLQYRLLPTGVPVKAPVSIAAALESYCHLSGDLFGWQMLADGKFLFWIADVSGHGLETGLASAILKAILDGLREVSRVDELLGELNEAWLRCIRPGGRTLFATGFFIMLAADGMAEYCSAGHPTAIVVAPPTQGLRELAATSRPIGLFQGQRFLARAIRMAPGETLFLYTDGLIELTTLAGEPFGLQRLRAFLQGPEREPKQITESLYRRIAAEHDMTRLDDDVSFVTARMRES